MRAKPPWPSVRLIEAGRRIVGFAIRQRHRHPRNAERAGPPPRSGRHWYRRARSIDASPRSRRIRSWRGRASDRRRRRAAPKLSFESDDLAVVGLRQKVLVNEHDRPIAASTRAGRSDDAAATTVDWVISARACSPGRGQIERRGPARRTIFHVHEDVDLCAAMREQGRRVLFVTEAKSVILTDGRAETAAHARPDMRIAAARSHFTKASAGLGRHLLKSSSPRFPVNDPCPQ